MIKWAFDLSHGHSCVIMDALPLTLAFPSGKAADMYVQSLPLDVASMLDVPTMLKEKR